MVNTFKILSLFLSYPGKDLQDFLPQGIEEMRREHLLDLRSLAYLEEFAAHHAGMDLIDWQANFVDLFDTSRNTSLYIFEHLKGDSKERGQAMADLMDFYRENGLVLSGDELPDYLPVFLEFLSTLDLPKAAELLSQTVNVIDRICSILKEKDNPYMHVLAAVISLSSEMPDNECHKCTEGTLSHAGFDELYNEPPAFSGDSVIPDN